MPTEPVRRSTLLFGLVVLALSGSSNASAAERPNVVLCMADDQGWGDVGYNGHPTLKTPVLDEMAATGLRFDHFYAAAPVCSPTRFSVLTGRHPNRGGVFKWGYALRPQEITIAEALKSKGYATGHFGKWHLGSVRKDGAASPGAAGFDTWLSSPNFYENDVLMSREGTVVRVKGESSMLAVDAALEFVDAATKQEKPFLAVIWFGNPHTPHQPTPELAALYPDQPKAVRNYLAEVTGIDRAMGRLRDELRSRDLAENTLVWYTSDNGARRPGSTGGMRAQKGSIYEGGLRVPAVVEWPARIRKPRSTDVRCNTSDVYPTLLELVGVEMPGQPPLDGVSLVPLLAGEMKRRPGGMGFWDFSAPGISTPSPKLLEALRREQAGETAPTKPRDLELVKIKKQYPLDSFPGHAAWIDGKWKLHRIQPAAGKKGKLAFELYDLENDPREQTDVLAEHPEQSTKLKAELDVWQRSVVQSLNGEDYAK